MTSSCMAWPTHDVKLEGGGAHFKKLVTGFSASQAMQLSHPPIHPSISIPPEERWQRRKGGVGRGLVDGTFSCHSVGGGGGGGVLFD